ncbi:MAG: hypothetical protein WCF90_09415 [Methanomicrobiales archaeon]
MEGGLWRRGGSRSANLKITDQNFQQIKRVAAHNVAISVYRTAEHMKIDVGSDDIVAVVNGLPSDYVQYLLKLQDRVCNNGNSDCLIGPIFAKDHNLKMGSRISIGTNGDKGTLIVMGIIAEWENEY